MTTTTLDANELSRDLPAPGLLGLAERAGDPDVDSVDGFRKAASRHPVRLAREPWEVAGSGGDDRIRTGE